MAEIVSINILIIADGMVSMKGTPISNNIVDAGLRGRLNATYAATFNRTGLHFSSGPCSVMMPSMVPE